MEEAADKIQSVKPTISYAQAARIGSARATPGQETPLVSTRRKRKALLLKSAIKRKRENQKPVEKRYRL
jgi:hypothetical protein